MVITTRDATLFSDRFHRLTLGVFTETEAHEYIERRFAAMGGRPKPEHAADLVAEVGLVPQQLDLAAGYLEKNLLVNTAEYVDKLRARK